MQTNAMRRKTQTPAYAGYHETLTYPNTGAAYTIPHSILLSHSWNVKNKCT